MTHRTATVSAILAAALFWWSAVAAADQCESYGGSPFMSIPPSGVSLATNARFEVKITPSCGELEGPPVEARLTGSDGEPVPARVDSSIFHPDCEPVPCRQLVFTPTEPLNPGDSVRVEVRTPQDTETLGNWRSIASWTMTDRVDRDTPTFSGDLETRLFDKRESIPFSHDEKVDVYYIEFVFPLAKDGADADELLYAIEVNELGETAWKEVESFRPTRRDDGRGVYTHRLGRPPEKAARYRVVARDASGHVGIGPSTTLGAPSHSAQKRKRATKPTKTGNGPPASCATTSVRGSWTHILALALAGLRRRK